MSDFPRGPALNREDTIDRPVFLFGTQRSGTTLVFQVLNGLDQLHLVNEFWDLFDFITHSESRLPRSQRAELSRLTGEHLELSPEDIIELEATAGDALDLAAHAMSRLAQSKGKTRWGLKDPRLSDYLDVFATRYPNARFVGLLRDPRAVVASYLTRKMNIANVRAGAELWTHQVTRQQDFVQRHPERAIWVRFEELLGDFEAQVKRLCEFLGEAYDPSLLEYYRRKPETKLHRGNANIQSPPKPAVAQRWKETLSRRQVGIIEATTHPIAQQVGYRCSVKPVHLSALEQRAYALHQWVLTTYWWQQRTSWSGVRKRLGLPYDTKPKLG